MSLSVILDSCQNVLSCSKSGGIGAVPLVLHETLQRNHQQMNRSQKPFVSSQDEMDYYVQSWEQCSHLDMALTVREHHDMSRCTA